MLLDLLIMWDTVIAAGKGFKGPSMHDLRGYLLQKEIMSIEEYLKEFKDSWVGTGSLYHTGGIARLRVGGLMRKEGGMEGKAGASGSK